MEFQTTLQNGKAYSCTPLHSHLDVKQPFQDFTVKKNPIYLSFTEQAQSIQRYTYIKKKIKGTFLLHGTGGWCQGTARGDDAAWSSSPLHQTGALLLADGDTGMLRCARRHPTSSTFIYLAGSKTRPGNEASADFEEHSGKRLRTEDWTPAEVETGRSLPASAAHHEGNRSHPGWTVWESDRGEGIDTINMKIKTMGNAWRILIVIVMTIIFHA